LPFVVACFNYFLQFHVNSNNLLSPFLLNVPKEYIYVRKYSLAFLLSLFHVPKTQHVWLWCGCTIHIDDSPPSLSSFEMPKEHALDDAIKVKSILKKKL
jgi:hypothetical protein